MVLFWSFLVYSFFGFLLEVIYARATGGRRDRKCFFVLPLCPVYGLGACAILSLPDSILQSPVSLFLLGGLTATVTEYLIAVLYEKGFGVSFWDYRDLPGNLHGRVCLPFSLVWGALSLPLVYWLHPALLPLLSSIPSPLSWLALSTVLTDGAVSALLLKRTGLRTSLRWYAP